MNTKTTFKELKMQQKNTQKEQFQEHKGNTIDEHFLNNTNKKESKHKKNRLKQARLKNTGTNTLKNTNNSYEEQ